MTSVPFHRHPGGALSLLGNFTLYHTSWASPMKNRVERLRGLAKQRGLSREGCRRLEWMLWYEEHGKNARATCRHFGIPPKTFYIWKRRFCDTYLPSLEDRSHRPRRVRVPTITPEEERRVVALRQLYPHYSKMKLAVIYRERFGGTLSSWKIQRVIALYHLYPNPKKAARTTTKRLRAEHKKRITNLVTKPRPGFLFCLDTVVRNFDGKRRYIITAVDRYSRLAFARMYKTHSSLTAADFLRKLHLVLGGQLVNVQTDNGCEFHKHFEGAIRDLKLQHWWSRAKTPKDNAVCERFNRTLQDEFIGRGHGYSDPAVFNRDLTDWLVEYDFHRPHTALGYLTPIKVACSHPKVLPITPSHTLSGHRAESRLPSLPFPSQLFSSYP
jgi:transposase InsO family protein